MTAFLSAIAVRTGSEIESVEDVLLRTGSGPSQRRVFARAYGLRSTRVLASGERLEDLLIEAGREALARTSVQLVLYGHTLLFQPMAHRRRLADRLREGLGLQVPVYGITGMACTSVLRSIELAARYLERTAEAEAVLVLGGDQGSVHDLARVIPNVTVAGDGAAAVVVRRTRSRFAYVGSAGYRAPEFFRAFPSSRDELRAFGETTAELAVDVARAAAKNSGSVLSEIDWIMPHHNNTRFWSSFSRTTKFPRERIHLATIGQVGHAFGIDSLIALDHADRSGLLKCGQRCLLISLGQGVFVRGLVLEIGDGNDARRDVVPA